MKRRIAFTLAAIMATTMLSACGGNAPSETQPQTSGNDSGTSAVTSESNTSAADTTSSAPEATTSATTSETTTAAPEEPVVPEELPTITSEPQKFANIGYISNGSMAFKCDGKNYVYNITDNELYETEHDISEIEVLKGNIAVFGNVYDDFTYYYGYIPYVVNLKTGEQYADVRPFYNSDWRGSYLTVGKLEESFSGNTMSIGMLNDKGEWVLPLSADYAVCKEKDIDKTSSVCQNSEIISFWADGEYNYDIANDKLIEDVDTWDVTDNRIILFDSFDITKSTYKFYNYDVSTGEKTFITESGYFGYETPTCIIHYSDVNKGFKIFDQDFNLLEHDLSEYNLGGSSDKSIRGANQDVIVFNAPNDEGDTYTIILNKDGSYVCEPYKYDKREDGVYDAYFSENKIILKYNKTNDRIIDRNTGEITTFDDSFEIVDYDTENNLMLVKTNGAYYLADPEAPDVLINPFERTKN